MTFVRRRKPLLFTISLVILIFVTGFLVINQPNASTAAQFNGTLKLALQPIDVTDPLSISADSEIALANAVYDYLVDVDANNELQPRLATDWTVSEDGLTYTFNLAEGVTFHDGSALRPEDVVYTFDRLRDPDVAGATADLYSGIESIEASGPNQVTFTLSTTNPFFLFDLSDNHAVVVKEGSTDLADFNGTGPFIVQDGTLSDQIIMEANPNYFIEGQPSLQRLEFIFFDDQVASIDALRSGQIDLIWRISNTNLLSLDGEPGITTIDIPTNGFDIIRLRTDREPGNDPRVIEALKLATDRTAIWDGVQRGLGAIGRDSPIGPVFTQFYSEATPIPERDPEAARQLLTDAGYPDGLELDLHVPNTGGRPAFATIIQQQWAEAGIDVNILLEPESIYYGEGNWLEVNLGITGWGSRPTPQFYFDVMLECDAIWNESKFCDAELDELSETAGSTLDEGERIEAYQDMQRILIERGPVIIPYFFAQTAAISDAFDGFHLKAFAGRTDFRTVSTN